MKFLLQALMETENKIEKNNLALTKNFLDTLVTRKKNLKIMEIKNHFKKPLMDLIEFTLTSIKT